MRRYSACWGDVARLSVTRDIDEASWLGDYLCLPQGGTVARFGTPEAILAHPAQGVRAQFLGCGRALRRLDLVRAAVMTPVAGVAAPAGVRGDSVVGGTSD